MYREKHQIRYIGPKKSLSNYNLDKKWMEEFGSLIGLKVSDLINIHNFSKDKLKI